MQNTIYRKLLDEVERLTQTDQLRLLEQIAVLIRRKAPGKPRRSIMELQGLGKETWQDIDAQKYVDEERTRTVHVPAFRMVDIFSNARRS